MWKISIHKSSTPEPVGRGHNGPRRGRPPQADEEGEEIYSNSTLAEEASEATKLSNVARLKLI